MVIPAPVSSLKPCFFSRLRRAEIGIHHQHPERRDAGGPAGEGARLRYYGANATSNLNGPPPILAGCPELKSNRTGVLDAFPASRRMGGRASALAAERIRQLRPRSQTILRRELEGYGRARHQPGISVRPPSRLARPRPAGLMLIGRA